MLPCKKLRFTEQTAVKERQGGGCPVSLCKTKEIPVRGFSSPHRDFSMTAYLTACRFGASVNSGLGSGKDKKKPDSA